MAEYQQVTYGMDDGAVVGRTSTSLVGFYGATPVAQIANIATVTTTAATSTSPWGYDSSTQANAVVTAINSLISAMTNLGLVASA